VGSKIMLDPKTKAKLLNASVDPDVRSDVKNKDRALGHLILNGVELKYRDMSIIVDEAKLDEARQIWNERPRANRRMLARSIALSLEANYQDILEGRFTKKQADDFHGDMLFWAVINEAGKKDA